VQPVVSRVLNEALAELEAIKCIALAELNGTDANSRVGLLKTIIRTIEIKINLLQDAGILPRAMRRTGINDTFGNSRPTTENTRVHVSFLEVTNDSPPVELKVIDVAEDGAMDEPKTASR
jgi:hypothetical protein